VSKTEQDLMKSPNGLTVNVSHDVKEGLWYVLSSDVPGLNAEAETFDALIEIIADLAPDLIAANLPEIRDAAQIPICVQHTVSVKRAHAA
jgi:hypothetical protein